MILSAIAISCCFVSTSVLAQTNNSIPSQPESPKIQLPRNMNQQNNNGNTQDEEKPIGYLNWQMPTLGGQQFWTDVRYASGWRIQKNSQTGHFRLLNPGNIRHAWGNQLHCDQKLNELIVSGKAKLDSGKVAFVLHGLIRTSSSMTVLAKHLKDQGQYTTINFQYASTRKSVGDHAIALKSVIDQLGPDVTEINFVGHSLGNIVVRRYLGDTRDPLTGKQGDPRVRRVVMIGPPNQGSKMARILKSSVLFGTIAGVSGAELSRGWGILEPSLATPSCEFGIIAGAQANEKDLGNFVLKGKDDFTVSLEETKLVGANDFLVKPLFHSTMMHQKIVLDATLNFFQNGYFVSAEQRNPITTLGN